MFFRGVRHYNREKTLGPAKPLWYIKGQGFLMEPNMYYQVCWNVSLRYATIVWVLCTTHVRRILFERLVAVMWVWNMKNIFLKTFWKHIVLLVYTSFLLEEGPIWFCGDKSRSFLGSETGGIVWDLQSKNKQHTYCTYSDDLENTCWRSWPC